ncbi:MAG TPA: alpha/beta fold hydrolase [Sporichthya sp.]|jgi:proline iminopeptidase|nr:alpha/beta fold hydrolase [Sporichthya sp.]
MHTIADLREESVAGTGAELYVRRAGAGDAVLLAVHGGPGLSHGPLAALEALASSRLVVVNYDQRGVGRSSGTVDGGNVLAQAMDDLEAVRRAVSSAPVHVLGHSWGGLLAAVYAAERPDAVASLTLVDSIPAHAAALESAFETYGRRLRGYQARGLVPGDLPTAEIDPVGRLLALLPIYFVDPTHPAARSLGGIRPSPAVGAAHQALLRSYDVRDLVARVVAPSLHFIAPVPFGPGMAAAMADAMPASRARRVHLSDAGHLPWLERPSTFFAELRTFLNEVTNPNRKDQSHDP